MTKLQSVDLTRDMGRLTLSGLLIPVGQLLDVDSARLRATAAALFSAEAAGVARWCQTNGLAYTKVREQFGRTIASFQAIKHKCARLFVRSEMIAAAAWDAAEAFSPGRGPVRPRRGLRRGDLPARRGGHRPGDGHAVRRHRLHVGARHPPVLAPRDEPGKPARPARPLGAGTGRARPQDRTSPRTAAGRRARGPARLGRRPAGRRGGAARRTGSGRTSPSRAWPRRTTRAPTGSGPARWRRL